MDIVVLFFLFGLLAGLLKADLRLPSPIYDFLTVFLLLAIGLKGGAALSREPLLPLLPQLLAVVVMGVVLALIAYGLTRLFSRLPQVDAAALAAHYGSVSVGTYAVAVAFLGARQIPYEAHIPVFVALLEAPAILVALLLARKSRRDNSESVLRDLLLGRSVLVLVGGLVIGWLAGAEQLDRLAPLFVDLFDGVLAIFLLEMGLVAAAQLPSLRVHWRFLLAFGTLFPLFGAIVGTGLGLLLGLSAGGITLLAVLAASASYIAAPAALRLALPTANPTLTLAASLGVTFPFNVTIGIPLYNRLAQYVSAGGV